MKLPYDYIVDRAQSLIDLAATLDEYNSVVIIAELNTYLFECGWTDSEFDFETLKRIDASWDNNESIN